MALLEKLTELIKNISNDEMFVKRIKAYSDKEKNPKDNPFSL